MHPPLVWINGFPGTGKLTVAKVLVALDNSIILIDNHKMIDPVEGRIPRNHPDYQRERRAVREAVFAQGVISPDSLSHPVVFTDFQSDNELGKKVACEYKLAALQAARPFIPIYLTCNEQENLARVSSLSRQNSGTTKLTSTDILRAIRSRSTLYRFDDCAGLTIDVTRKTPKEAAREIYDYLQALEVSLPEVPTISDL